MLLKAVRWNRKMLYWEKIKSSFLHKVNFKPIHTVEMYIQIFFLNGIENILKHKQKSKHSAKKIVHLCQRVIKTR